MTYLQIKNLIYDTAVNAGIKLTGDVVYNIGNFVNERQRKICNKKNFWFMRNKANCNTIIAQQSYSIITTPGFNLPLFKDDKMLYFTEDNSMCIIEMISYSDAVKTYADDDTGAPENFTFEDDTAGLIKLWPIPDRVVTMTFLVYQFLADLALDSGTNTLTDEMPEILINGALADLFALKNMESKSAEFEAKYGQNYKDLNARDIKKRLPAEMALIPRNSNLASGISPNVNRLWDEWF
jgi:hypothetical protein